MQGGLTAKSLPHHTRWDTLRESLMGMEAGIVGATCHSDGKEKRGFKLLGRGDTDVLVFKLRRASAVLWTRTSRADRREEYNLRVVQLASRVLLKMEMEILTWQTRTRPGSGKSSLLGLLPHPTDPSST